ncbi:hypothetical protein Tco_1225288 [Tanacetum coccineum]
MISRTTSPDHSSQEYENENHQITFSESRYGFDVSFMIKQDLLNKISKQKLLLNKEQAFKIPRTCGLLKPLRRKNEIYYFVNSKEMHVDISETTGAVYLPLITKDEINKSLSKIKSDIKSKISCVHLGAVKFLIKSEFRSGIDTPIKMALLDNRIESRKYCILGIARGNLAYSRYKKKGHWNDDLFTKIDSVKAENLHNKTCDETWAINIAKIKMIGSKTSTQSKNKLQIGKYPTLEKAFSSKYREKYEKIVLKI